MEFLLKFDLNLYAIMLLTALLLVILLKRELNTLRGRIFRWIIIITMMMNILEIFSWIFDGKDGELFYFLHFFFNFWFTGINTLVVCLWLFYIDFTIFEDIERLKKRYWYFAPIAIVMILSIINIFTPILFVIDDANIYARLPLVWISIIFTIIIYIYTVIMVARNRRKVTSQVLLGVLVFLSLPIFASLLQLWFYGLIVIWPVTSLALVFSYLIFETTSSSRDFLTGAFTRMRAEEFINKLISKKRKFSVVMIDLDDFKVINDTFGHHVGDAMLVEMTSILNVVFVNKSVVSRYGGDEFLIVVEGTSGGDLQLYRQQIQQHLTNSISIYAQAQKFSFGVAYCENFDAWTMESIITTADNNMYLDKAKNKNYKRRKSDQS